MRLDVVVPTYNRTRLLRPAVASLLRAPVPDGLEVRILVIDNNSTDGTEQVVREMQADGYLPIVYIRETKQGLSHSRNAGIANATGDLVGFIDDDEEIEENWYTVIHREFADPTVEYIGGPCLPNWQADIPDWLPPGYHSVIGAIPPKPRGHYGPGHPGMLNGGNAVIRRTVFEKIGGYSTRLGRSGKGLLSEEDAEFFRRIQAAGVCGMYVPDLAIYHYIPAERLTRKYHRRWAYWRAVSQGLLDRESPEKAVYLLGLPRHRIGRAVRSLINMPLHYVRGAGKGRVFADELAAWDLAGFLYGKYMFKPDEYYAAKE